MKYRYDGKAYLRTFGAYSKISLEEARDRREETRKRLAGGIDPALEKRAARTARVAQKGARHAKEANTFLEDSRKLAGSVENPCCSASGKGNPGEPGARPCARPRRRSL
ncbi:MAG: Arm DNA-binding domain-containing protein [Candidatus Accumulibacter sp.]|nr:Arm DNA-binding domain-containing protein [Accumulibacter sp.]